MEFPGLGGHCSFGECNKLDFLPVKCDACKSRFCNDHFLYDAHSCPIKHTKDGDGKIASREKAMGTTKNRCSVNKCKQTEFIKVVCERCHQNHCLKHRLPSDHQCQEPTVSSSPSALAGPLSSTPDARQDSGSLPEEGPRSQKDSLTPRPPRPEAGTVAGAEKDEDGNRHQVPPSKPRRKVKCGKCPACKASDCGNCRTCKDKPKFGGPNKLKQGCVEKKCPNMTYAKSEVNENECLEPNRNALAQPKQKGSKAVFKVPAVPRAKSQCKPKPKVPSIPRAKSLCKPMTKKALEEARRLREMEPVGVMTWDPMVLRRSHKPGGLLVDQSTIDRYEHQCSLCKMKFPTLPGLLNHDVHEHVYGGFRFTCFTCTEGFKTEEEVGNHQRTLLCEVCGITFTCQNGFKGHKRKRNCLAPGDSFYGFEEVKLETRLMSLEKQARFLSVEDKAESGIPGFPGFWNVQPAGFWNVESDGRNGGPEKSIVCPLGQCANPFNCLLDSGLRAKD